MNLLVTGGAGFIGSNFVTYWLNKYKNDKVINLDKLTYAGHLSSLEHLSKNKNYEFVRGDICSTKVVDELVKKVDVIVHFAAESHVDRSIKDPKAFIKTNVLGTYTLLESAKKFGIERFHHVSTDEVFGSLNLNSSEKFTEETPYDPRSPYSASKASSDHLVRAYHETYGLNVTITNCSNNFGPFQDPEKLLPRFITNLIEDKHIPVYGDGKNVRDWLYVEDHCSAIDKVIQNGNNGETYLVGGMNKDASNLEIARKLLNIFNKDESYIEFVEDRKGHDKKYAVDWTKINKELGWEPAHKFDHWLGETVNWYQKNEWWWKPLKVKAENFYKRK